MAATVYFRGGNSVRPRSWEVRFDRKTGLLRTTHGVSVSDRPDGLGRFGGAHRIESIPEGLQIVQRGNDLHHFEIVPASPMTLVDYEKELEKVVLAPA